MCRWLALSFLAERYQKKMKDKGEEPAKTDAQGIPFRCIMLIAFCNVGFFGTAIIIAGMDGMDRSGLWAPVFLGVMIVMLVAQIKVLSGGGWRNVVDRLKKERTGKSDDVERQTKDVINSPMQDDNGIEMIGIYKRFQKTKSQTALNLASTGPISVPLSLAEVCGE